MKIFIFIGLLLFFALPAIAQEITLTPDIDKDILANIAEKEGFCNRPRKKNLEPGEIVVDYGRDENDRCVVQAVRVGK
jgi:hypothetical protein